MTQRIKRTKYLGPCPFEYCLTNNEYVHIHVQMKWNPPQYILEKAWFEIKGVNCNQIQFPYNKNEEFNTSVTDLLNKAENKLFDDVKA